jgi:hypothetical protein
VIEDKSQTIDPFSPKDILGYNLFPLHRLRKYVTSSPKKFCCKPCCTQIPCLGPIWFPLHIQRRVTCFIGCLHHVASTTCDFLRFNLIYGKSSILHFPGLIMYHSLGGHQESNEALRGLLLRCLYITPRTGSKIGDG